MQTLFFNRNNFLLVNANFIVYTILKKHICLPLNYNDKAAHLYIAFTVTDRGHWTNKYQKQRMYQSNKLQIRLHPSVRLLSVGVRGQFYSIFSLNLRFSSCFQYIYYRVIIFFKICIQRINKQRGVGWDEEFTWYQLKKKGYLSD